MHIENRKILITGVTGTLGGRVASKMKNEGAEVIVLIRNQSLAQKFRDEGFVPLIGDLTDSTYLSKIMKGIDYVINCAAYLGEDTELAIASNITGVKFLAHAALDNSVKKFIHISTTSVYGEPQSGHLDEDSPLAYDHPETYISTKIRSEQILSAYNDKGLPVIILRSGAICAETNSYWGDNQVKRMLSCDNVTWVHPDDSVPWVHADNLAEMIYIALLDGIDGEVYHAIDLNVDDRHSRVQLAIAAKKKIIPPNRQVEKATYTVEKIREIGYRPLKTFEQTMNNLIKLVPR